MLFVSYHLPYIAQSIMRLSKYRNVIERIDAVNKADPMKVVIYCLFGTPSLIYKLQPEFAHNSGCIKTVLDQLNAIIINL